MSATYATSGYLLKRLRSTTLYLAVERQSYAKTQIIYNLAAAYVTALKEALDKA